jgi:DNA-binding response OmpR family regulator
MGEQILREEGYEVVSVADGETAAARIISLDPDVVIADTALPKRSGFDLCRWVKSQPAHKHTKVVFSVGALESVDDAAMRLLGADGVVRRPFEASIMTSLVRPLAQKAQLERRRITPSSLMADREAVRAAVGIALDEMRGELVDTITEKVMMALTRRAASGS